MRFTSNRSLLKFFIPAFAVIFIMAFVVFQLNQSFEGSSFEVEMKKNIGLSRELFSKGKLDESMKISKKILERSKECSYSDGILNACLNISNILILRYNFREADRFLKMAQNENQIVKSSNYDDQINTILGDRLAKTGLHLAAIKAYKKNLNSSTDLTVAANTKIASCFEQLHLLDSALFYGKNAYQVLIKKKGARNDQALVAVSANIALSYLHMKGDVDSARFYLNKGMLLAEKGIQSPGLLMLYKGFGLLATNASNVDSGILYLQKALVIARNKKDPGQITDLHEKMASSLEIKKDPLKYIEHMKLHKHYSDSLDRLGNVPFLVRSMMRDYESVLNQRKKEERIRMAFIIAFFLFLGSLFAYFRFKKYKIE